MGTSVVDTPGKKKLSGTAKGYLILFGSGSAFLADL